MNSAKLIAKFAKIIKHVLKHCEVETDATGDPPADAWRIVYTGGHSFVMKQSAMDYYYDGLNLLREHVFKKNYKNHEYFFDQIYYEFIQSQKLKQGRLYHECKNWLEYIEKLKTTKFRVMLPINYYKSTREIKLDNIKIIKQLNKDIFRHYFGDTDPFDLITPVKNNAKCAKYDAYAIVDVEAFDKDGAKEVGYIIVEKFAHAIRFIDPESYIQFGKESAIRLSEVSINQSHKELSFSVDHKNIPMSVYLDNNLDKLKPYWDKLMNFLYAAKPTNLQKIIANALYWFGISDIYRDSNEKLFLNYIIGLELIILHDYKQNDKADRFGKNYQQIFSDTSWTVWKKAYQKRNQIVHSGSVNIYKEEVEKIGMDLRNLLKKLIDFTDKYDELNDVLKEEYDIDNKNISRKQKTCSKQLNFD